LSVSIKQEAVYERQDCNDAAVTDVVARPVEFAPQKLASGVYFYRLQAGEFSIMKKMVLIQQ